MVVSRTLKYEILQLYRLVFPNNKVYIGYSYNAFDRFKNGHCYLAKSGVKHPLYYAMRKYGCDNVKLELLVVGSYEYIRDLEIAAIAKFKSCDRDYGYNIHFGGSTSPMTNPEVAFRVTEQLRGRPHSLAHIESARQGLLLKIATNPKLHSENCSKGQKRRSARKRADRLFLLVEDKLDNFKKLRNNNLEEARKNSLAIRKGVKVVTNGVINKRVDPKTYKLEEGFWFGLTPSVGFQTRTFQLSFDSYLKSHSKKDWATNGYEDIMISKDASLPLGFERNKRTNNGHKGLKRSEQSKQKMRNAKLGKKQTFEHISKVIETKKSKQYRWFQNGKIEVYVPSSFILRPGFKPGRLDAFNNSSRHNS